MRSCFRGSIAGRGRQRAAVAAVLATLGMIGLVDGAGMVPSEQVLPDSTRAWVSARDFRATRERFLVAKRGVEPLSCPEGQLLFAVPRWPR